MKKRTSYIHIPLHELLKKLEQSRDKCEFKKAIIPKGWTCINIRKFVKGLEGYRREEGR